MVPRWLAQGGRKKFGNFLDLHTNTSSIEVWFFFFSLFCWCNRKTWENLCWWLLFPTDWFLWTEWAFSMAIFHLIYWHNLVWSLSAFESHSWELHHEARVDCRTDCKSFHLFHLLIPKWGSWKISSLVTLTEFNHCNDFFIG